MNKVGRTLTAAAAVATPVVGTFAVAAPAASASVYRAVPAVSTPHGSLELWYDSSTREAYGKLVRDSQGCISPGYLVEVRNTVGGYSNCYASTNAQATGRIDDAGTTSAASVQINGTTYKTQRY